MLPNSCKTVNSLPRKGPPAGFRLLGRRQAPTGYKQNRRTHWNSRSISTTSSPLRSCAIRPP